MKKFFYCLTLLSGLIGWNPLASAIPALSADGSMLSGLNVNGTLYDIEFLDGVISEVFPAEQMLSPGWYELAGSVTTALYHALDDMALTDNGAIRGCKDNSGIPGYIPPNLCLIATMDKWDAPDYWGASNIVVIGSSGPYYGQPPFTSELAGDTDTASPTWDFLTLARFSPTGTSIPIPGSLLLTLSGLFLVARRSKSCTICN